MTASPKKNRLHMTDPTPPDVSTKSAKQKHSDS